MFATSLALLASTFRGRDRGTAFGVWGAVTGRVRRGRPAGRRRAHRGLRLGVDLLRQRPHRHRRDRPRAREGRRVARPGRGPAQARLARRGDLLGGAVPAHLRAHPRQRRGLGQHRHRRDADRRGGAPGRLRARRAPPPLAHARPAAVRATAPSSARPSPPSCCRRRCSRCSSTSRSTCRTSSATPRSRPACASCPSRSSSFAVAPVSGKLAERVGIRYFLGGGLALVGIGLLLMGGLDARDDWTALLGGFLVAGAGIGLVNPALATAAVGVVEPQRAGMASGINSTFRQVGIATGIAGLGRDLPVRRELPRGRVRADGGVRGRPPAGRRGRGPVLRLHLLRRLQADRRGRRDRGRRARRVPRGPQRHPALRGHPRPRRARSLSLALVRPRDFVSHG